MMKNNGNGHNSPAETLATIPASTPIPTDPLVPKDGDKEPKKQATTKLSTVASAFHSPHSTQAVDYLVVAGKEILDMAMRGNFSTKNTEGHQKVRALARHLAKCEEFKDDLAKAEALMVAAGDVSIDGQGREDLVRALTGYNQNQQRMKGQNLFNKFSDWVHGGRGNDKEVKEQPAGE